MRELNTCEFNNVSGSGTTDYHAAMLQDNKQPVAAQSSENSGGKIIIGFGFGILPFIMIGGIKVITK